MKIEAPQISNSSNILEKNVKQKRLNNHMKYTWPEVHDFGIWSEFPWRNWFKSNQMSSYLQSSLLSTKKAILL